MVISLKPEIERFLNEQIKAGRFVSASEAVEAGIARLMLDSETDQLDSRDIADIQESLSQMQRGEVVDWREYSKEWREKHVKP